MDVVVVGSCMTDLVSYVPRLPTLGETLHGHKFSMGFGGKGANQCIAASRLGASTAMVAKLGSDTFGDNYLKNFKDNNVNTEHVGQTAEAATGVAPIAVDDKGDNSIIIVAGANHCLSRSDLEGADDLITSAKVVICQLEIKPEVTLAAMTRAKNQGVCVVLNPAPAVKRLDDAMYSSCDIFCPNETEAEILTGTKVASISDASAAIKALQGKGCSTVIITMGSQGAVFAEPGQEAKHVAASPVNAVDSTGAGDAFVGALGYYLACMPQLTLSEKIQRSCTIASFSVERPGTQTSYRPKHELPKELFQV
ncbi:unnamed protein product [Owenia fusiformis]|uniref:Ribokinase n=1 Tax=Owenia fusiformis TaxID=6347 RepID=A0A8J1U8E4_OWEFU|nr:unnamed protein product [Owenia fusiformis]